jgi:hypothetical protein
VKETAAVLVDGQGMERIQQDSSFSGWDAFLCDEEDDGCGGSSGGGGASHHSYITDAHRSGQMEEKQSRWRDEKEDDRGNATVVCTHRQPVKKRQRMQHGLSMYTVDSNGRASCVNKQGSKNIEPTASRSRGERSLKRHPSDDASGDGQEKSAWFAEFLDE